MFSSSAFCPLPFGFCQKAKIGNRRQMTQRGTGIGNLDLGKAKSSLLSLLLNFGWLAVRGASRILYIEEANWHQPVGWKRQPHVPMLLEFFKQIAQNPLCFLFIWLIQVSERRKLQEEFPASRSREWMDDWIPPRVIHSRPFGLTS